MYVLLTNYVNWHRENLQSHRENTGKFKIQFEWVPCRKNLPDWQLNSAGQLPSEKLQLGIPLQDIDQVGF